MITKEQLQERAQLVRIHEANCGILFPSGDEVNFRLAIMKKLAQDLGLRELRATNIAGPAVSVPARLVRRESPASRPQQ
jgi:hypothetical protein